MKQKLLQERPNTDTAFFTNSAEGISKIKEYTDAGRLTKTESVSENGLVKTIEIEYTSIDDYDDFTANEVVNNEKANREKYCADNSISFSLTEE
tara:strand:+ start:764 stop:1045 length:282 start_codon:yes stop_codon:yes gene_type:complete